MFSKTGIVLSQIYLSNCWRTVNSTQVHICDTKSKITKQKNTTTKKIKKSICCDLVCIFLTIFLYIITELSKLCTYCTCIYLHRTVKLHIEYIFTELFNIFTIHIVKIFTESIKIDIVVKPHTLLHISLLYLNQSSERPTRSESLNL